MGAGVPVLVSRTGSFEELPDEAAGKVDVGDIEEELLVEYLLLLARRPEVREAMARAARRYVAEHHRLEGAARGYLEFLGALSGHRREVTVPEVPSGQGIVSPTMPPARAPVWLAAAARPATKERPPDDPVAILAEVAAELGIPESDDISLGGLAEALADLLPSGEQ
jgi:hypothetical protein